MFNTPTWKLQRCFERSGPGRHHGQRQTAELKPESQSAVSLCPFLSIHVVFVFAMETGKHVCFLRCTAARSLQCFVFQHSGFLIINSNMLFIRAPDPSFHFLIQIVRLRERILAVQERTCCYSMLVDNTLKGFHLSKIF